MAQSEPEPTPEGRLIGSAAKATGRSIRQLAANAGMSDTRWRHIVKGWQPTTGGAVLPVRAPAPTLARIALVLDLTPTALADVGRKDAADLLVGLKRERRSELQQLPGRVHRNAPAPSGGRGVDEIDLIYRSKSMTAQEKLDAIRMVLQLRDQAEAEAEVEPAAERENAQNGA